MHTRDVSITLFDGLERLRRYLRLVADDRSASRRWQDGG